MSIRAHTSAARLGERASFERALRDGNGDVYDWQRIATDVHVAVDGDKALGPERVEADGTRSVAGYTVWMRSELAQRIGLTVADRMVWNGKYFDIKDMPDQGLQGRLVALRCEAGVNAG